jgi:hypothetical protein
MQVLQINTITSWKDILVIACGYILLLFTSGIIVSYLLKQVTNKTLSQVAGEDKPEAQQKKERLIAGKIIGKCENILILSFILMDAPTALALVVTAKTLIRKEEIERNEMFFLVGTLTNVSYSVLIGFAMRLLINASFT